VSANQSKLGPATNAITFIDLSTQATTIQPGEQIKKGSSNGMAEDNKND
jgi:hypothetical protein